jgi:hypothetical protein
MTSGTLDFLVPPGPHTLSISAVTGVYDSVALGSIPTNTTAGQTTNLGNTDYGTASMSGTLSWNGSPINGAWLGKYGAVFIRPVGQPAENVAIATVDSSGVYTSPILPPGDYFAEATVLLGPGGSVGTSSPVSVLAGGSATANIDTTASAGRLTGTVSTNGIPLAVGKVYFQELSIELDMTSGTLDFLVPPGPHTLSISAVTGAYESVLLFGIEGVQVAAAQTTTLVDQDLDGVPSSAEGQCGDDLDTDANGLVNDGCPQVGATPEAGQQCANANDDDGDNVVNDGCPSAGTEFAACGSNASNLHPALSVSTASSMASMMTATRS